MSGDQTKKGEAGPPTLLWRRRCLVKTRFLCVRRLFADIIIIIIIIIITATVIIRNRWIMELIIAVKPDALNRNLIRLVD